MTNHFNRRFWLWLLAGIGAVALAFPVDDAVDGALVVANPSSLHDVAWWCSKIGEGWVVGIGGILLAAFFVWLKKPVLAANIFFVALTSELAGLVATVFRVLIGRTRPTAPLPQGFSSFPSGHSASAVGLVAAAWLVNRGWGAAAAIYALAVMWSRIALNCHHLSDVVASTVLSIWFAVLFRKYFAPLNEKLFRRLAGRAK